MFQNKTGDQGKIQQEILGVAGKYRKPFGVKER
jgi:hypothetical protein